MLLFLYFTDLFECRYFIKNKNAGQAIEKNKEKNKVLCKILGVMLTIGQLILFIASGVTTSKHVWGW